MQLVSHTILYALVDTPDLFLLVDRVLGHVFIRYQMSCAVKNVQAQTVLLFAVQSLLMDCCVRHYLAS